MAPHGEPESEEKPRERGLVSLESLSTGMFPLIEKDGEKRRAEILSIQTRKGQPMYYVHYEQYNKRLDEWVPSSRMDLSQEVEWQAPEKDKGDKKEKTANQKSQPLKSGDSKANKNLKRPRSTLEGAGKENRESSSVSTPRPVPDGTPQPGEDDAQNLLMDVQAASNAAKSAPSQPRNREEEIEKLRTGGSMTQNQTEISRVRNLTRIQMGKHEIEPWYFSPYPSEFSDSDMVYICEFCLEYFGDYKPFERHRNKCTLTHPPGNEIYRDSKISFYEIDGRRQRTWSRNLCLLSKLFLDHKTLYYDVDPFLFYCMCTRDELGYHLVGYFSKEKESADGYNVACILTLPQFQRQGLGRLLIAFSYELSKREGKLGSPEKPLSDLGLLGYRAYWQEVIVDMLMEDGRSEMSVDEISSQTAMTTQDVVHTLNWLNMLRVVKNQHQIFLPDPIMRQWERRLEKEKVKGRHRIEPEKLVWRPPIFTASSRTWNW